MRSFALGALGALLALSGVNGQQCNQPCLDNENGMVLTCDDAVAQFNFTCDELEAWHCCDCSGCCKTTTTTTTTDQCDAPCQGSYSANNIVEMLGNGDEARCTAAINNGLAPDCDLAGCGCSSVECLEEQADCGFSCAQLVNAGFTCEDAAEAGCSGCNDCGCENRTTTAEPNACDTPCFENFDVS
jgi:hypothetical protein